MNKTSAYTPWSKPFLLIAALLFSLLCTSLHAAEYGRHDLKRLVQPKAPPATGATLDLAFLDKVLADLRQHAGNYPPHFDAPADAQRAQRDATALMGMLNAMFSTAALPSDMLLRLGVLGAVAHNLDAPGGAAFAQSYFEKLLKTKPDHAAGNYHYGTFLASTGRPKEALPYLLQAKAQGVTPALYGLGMSYLTLGDTAKALENLQAYQKAEPKDSSIGKLIEAIQSGRIETRKTSAQ